MKKPKASSNLRNLRRLPYYLAGVILVFLGLCEALLETPWGNGLRRLEWLTYDWRAKWGFEKSPLVSPKLAVMAIGDETLEAIKDKLHTGYPFPRWIHGIALKELAAQGAAGVAYDIFFIEPRPADALPSPGTARVGASDALFAQEIHRYGKVILGAPRDTARSEGLQPPAPAFASAAAGLGHSFRQLDADGIARRVTPVYDDPELGRVWLLGIALAARYLGYDLEKAEIDPWKITLPDREGQNHQIPLDGEGNLLIRWSANATDRGALRFQNLENVLASAAVRGRAGKEPPPLFADRLVIVGSSGQNASIADVGPTPLGTDTPYLAVHLNVANSLLTGNFVHPLDLTGRLGILCFITPLVAAASWKLRALWATLFNLGFGATYLGLSAWLYRVAGIWLPVAIPVFGLVTMTYSLMVAFRFYFERSQRSRVRGIFLPLVSDNTLELLLAQPHVSWEPEEKVMTVYFADIRGFTELTDRAPLSEGKGRDKETLALVNTYLGTVAETLMKHGATIDKYMGDCVMAFWNAPLENPKHAAVAVRAAMAVQQEIARLNRVRTNENLAIEKRNTDRALGKLGGETEPPHTLLNLGTGLSTGLMTVGFMGSERHLSNYTVFGREVNIAARLEGLSGSGRILATQATLEAAISQDPLLSEVFQDAGEVLVKGLSDPVSIFEVKWKTESESA